MKRASLVAAASFTALVLGASAAHAQSGHFVGRTRCRDIGTFAECTGKVVGLGGTTFQVTVSATGTASVECTSPGGEVAPGQSFTTTVTGSTDALTPLKNSPFPFEVRTDTPSAAPGSCPNPMWTARVIDVAFTIATLTLLEGGITLDTISVSVT
jgi:hypothetical protein